MMLQGNVAATPARYADGAINAKSGANEKQRSVDELKDQLRQLNAFSAENLRRVEQVANRLGYYPPKPNADGRDTPSPVPNGHIDELRSQVAAITDMQAAVAEFLGAIERQV